MNIQSHGTFLKFLAYPVSYWTFNIHHSDQLFLYQPVTLNIPDVNYTYSESEFPTISLNRFRLSLWCILTVIVRSCLTLFLLVEPWDSVKSAWKKALKQWPWTVRCSCYQINTAHLSYDISVITASDPIQTVSCQHDNVADANLGNHDVLAK